MSYNVALSQEIIEKVKHDLVPMVCDALGSDLKKITLYGSCSRGDFSADSDIDIAILTECDRIESKKYFDDLAKIASELAKRYLAIVNFVCLPVNEYEKKKDWYPYFKNIDKEGVSLYGR